MCIRSSLQWKCGHKILQWNFCNKGRKNKTLCIRAVTSPDITRRQFDNCCSTMCCQLDLIKKVETAIQLERKYGILPGKPWSQRLVEGVNEREKDVDEVALKVDRQRIADATEYHFQVCVHTDHHARMYTNEMRLENSQKPEWPLELGIPERPEISDEDRAEFQSILSNWRSSWFVTTEQSRYLGWLNTLSEEQKWQEQQWQEEMKWQLSNSRAVSEYARSTAMAVYRPILPAGRNPLVLAPGAAGSQFPPRREEDTTDIDISSTRSSQRSTRASTPSNSRPASRLERAGGSLGGATSASSQSDKHASNKRARVNTSDSDLSVEFVSQRPREKRGTYKEW